jgi:probable rRNA maturation factor
MNNVSAVGLPGGLSGGLSTGQDDPEPDSPGAGARADLAGFETDIQCDDTRWHPYLDMVEMRLGALAHMLALPAHGEVSVKLTDDTQIEALNTRFRGKAAATNVLSFPAQDFAAPMAPNALPETPFSLGDIVLAFDTLAREAESADKDFADHLAHLLVHGLLHLLGYDHQSDAAATQMETKETALLAKLGVGDPYAAAHTDADKADRKGAQ